MKNKILIALVILILAAGGVYIFIKQHPKKLARIPKAGKSGHPLVVAPQFELENVSGEKVVLSDFQGKAIVINFFATWCPPCRTEIPVFVKIYNQYKDHGLEIIGISLDNDPEEVLPEFINENSITYSVAIGTKDVLTRYGGVHSIPTTFFINRKGEITNVHLGFMDESTVEKETQKILKTDANPQKS